MKTAVIVAVACCATAHAFVRTPACLQGRQSIKLHAEKRPSTVFRAKQESFAPNIAALSPEDTANLLPAAGAMLAPFFLCVNEAAAKGGEYGIFEGKTISFIHPILMGALFLYTIYTGILGWQNRSIRTLASDMSALKGKLPKLQSGTKASFPLSKTIKEIENALKGLEEGDEKAAAFQADLSTLRSSSVAAIDIQYASLAEQRKSLTAKDPREKHYNSGSILLGLGVATAIFGPLNTWFRAGKLFPSPHLFAGAGIVVLWAAAAALVPAMSKGSQTARNVHIALNGLNLALFAWQVGTGLQIAAKVWELAPWP